ncbi:sporulation protein [Streptomyces qinzhouensis]|uniref:Sporulation protein n=1 Tax=Streptomyces qinzhouensis TaxID=2599401 RepID=A0A5B8IMP3_9ACTN|nr:sporulation protein [Streptomyces qinzhouensis]QDY79888.1 sporulation protein [Streptomyces qinzhouensis]
MDTATRSAKPPNHDLSHLLSTAAISRKALAARVNTLSARAGTSTAYTHTSVGNWLRGMHPRPPAPTLIAAVLAEHLGRPVNPIDIGMGASDTASTSGGLEFPRDPDQALALAASYWSTVDRRTLLNTPFVIGAFTGPALRWLATPTDSAPPRSKDGRRVGRADLDRLWTAADQARRADARHGGGTSMAVLHCLKATTHLLHGTYSSQAGRELFTATAELARIAGWAAVDMGRHAEAQRHLVQGLRLARAAGDTEAGCYVLSTMSLQAYLRGHITEAVDMAEGAYERARHVAAPRVLAFSKMAAAHAYGRAGDTRAASAAIATAERLLESIGTPTRDPAWIRYFTIERIASDCSEIFRDLGHPKAALRWSLQAAPMPTETRTRSVGLRTAVEATAFLQLRDLEQGLARADRALDILGQVTSTRGHDYLRTVNHALRPWSREPRVAHYLHRAGTVLART